MNKTTKITPEAPYRKEIWEQWERQQENRWFAELNNTYLRIERGEEKLSMRSLNRMYYLISRLWGSDDPMKGWWEQELESLPGFEDL